MDSNAIFNQINNGDFSLNFQSIYCDTNVNFRDFQIIIDQGYNTVGIRLNTYKPVALSHTLKDCKQLQ